MTVYKPWPYEKDKAKVGGLPQRITTSSGQSTLLITRDGLLKYSLTLVKFAVLLAWIQGCPEFLVYREKVDMAFKNLWTVAKAIFPLPKDWNCIDGSKIGKQ